MLTLRFLLEQERERPGGDGVYLAAPGKQRGVQLRMEFGNAGAGECLQDAVDAYGRRKDTLYITDSPALLCQLLGIGLPAVGYLHEGSREKTFTGAPYLVENPEEIDADSWIKIYQRLTGQPWIIALTSRLIIREHTPEDLEGLYKLYDDPQTRKFLEPLQEDRAREDLILRAYIEKVYGLYGYGMWAVCEKESGALIGRMGFAPPQGREPPSFGYLIRADRRRRGLATEAGRAVLSFADTELDFPVIGAQTATDNAASIALLRSLGFTGHSEENALQYFVRERKQS